MYRRGGPGRGVEEEGVSLFCALQGRAGGRAWRWRISYVLGEGQTRAWRRRVRRPDGGRRRRGASGDFCT